MTTLLPDSFAAEYGRPPGQPAALGPLMPGQSIPDGYGALLIDRPPYPRLADTRVYLRVGRSELSLAAGDFVIPVLPGRHDVSFHASTGAVLCATTVDVRPDEAVRLHVQLGPFRYGLTDEQGRQIAGRRRLTIWAWKLMIFGPILPLAMALVVLSMIAVALG